MANYDEITRTDEHFANLICAIAPVMPSNTGLRLRYALRYATGTDRYCKKLLTQPFDIISANVL